MSTTLTRGGAGGRGQEKGLPERKTAAVPVRVRTASKAAAAEGETFEKLEVWQDAIDLGALVYALFRSCPDIEFRSQIKAAAASVSNNIAEGYERDSNADFIRFLFIAKGSCGEVRSQAHFARRVRLLSETDAQQLIAQAKVLSQRLARFITVRRERFS